MVKPIVSAKRSPTMTAIELESLYAEYRRSVGDLERGTDWEF